MGLPICLVIAPLNCFITLDTVGANCVGLQKPDTITVSGLMHI